MAGQCGLPDISEDGFCVIDLPPEPHSQAFVWFLDRVLQTFAQAALDLIPVSLTPK